MEIQQHRSPLARWVVACGALWVAIVLAASAGAAAMPDPHTPGLAALMDRRLELMQEVAAYKWVHGRPIEDRQREAAVLGSSVDAALQVGMKPASAEAFFRAQIEAAKSVQAYWFARWERGGGPRQARDLGAEIRPQLLELGEKIIRAARSVGGGGCRALSRESFDHALRAPGLDDEIRSALFQAVSSLEFFDHRLEQITATGRLRVGTTGDYPPFSRSLADDPADSGGVQSFAGIDVDLARDLAASLGVEVRFVHTSWPDLLSDLETGRFDIAMSGVSRTLARQRVGFLSPAYYAGGKTPIARCEDVRRFDSLDRIDRPDVRVIVNPGGTNEAFVRQHLKRASITVFPDNTRIFARILAGDADVMITDRVEVSLQTTLHPQLCATMPGNLNYQEKAFLMPADPVWKEYVSTWLSLRLADGTVAAAFRRHGVEPGTASAVRSEAVPPTG